MSLSETIKTDQADNSEIIAITGMSLRVPGADSPDQFWQNLKNGTESITFFNDDQLRSAGVDEALLVNPDYVKAMGRLEGVELFDARFFDMTPKEAEILDPQHRVLMEGVWRALENAAIDPERYSGRIGLYAGVGFNGYLIHHILAHPELLESAGAWQLSLNNDKDFAPTRIAYKFNLQGPAVSINTACSTSLVATVIAAQSLLSYQCDTAIAGGCSIHLPQDRGYQYMKGGTVSPDGHCRPFDADAAGTVDGNGTAVVVMKRLEDALNDGDTIHALLRGFAMNNDGSLKVGYTAPSVSGQADVIMEALEMAELDASQIDYVETHGTGTELGDSVEISALSEAFRETAGDTGPCAIGSVKSNLGHLDTAAGTTGLIKTVLALQHGEIPPTCHFQRANPSLGLESTSFYVNDKLIPWPAREHQPRMAGVSSFGIGGTNAHVIVEQASQYVSRSEEEPKPWVIFPLAAKTEKALLQMVHDLADHIEARPDHSLADIAYTLQAGRRHFEYRRFLIVEASGRKKCCELLRDVTATLTQGDPGVIGESSDLTNSFITAGNRWLEGELIDWEALAGKRQRIPLPGHPFHRERYWIEPNKKVTSTGLNGVGVPDRSTDMIVKESRIDDWFYLPGWRRVMPPADRIEPGGNWLLVADSTGLAQRVAEELRQAGASVQVVFHTEGDSRGSTDEPFHINTTLEATWNWLFQTLGDWKPSQILHMGLYKPDSEDQFRQQFAFDGLVSLGQAMGQHFFSDEIRITLLADQLFPDGGTNQTDPARVTALGPLRVIAQEYPNISTRAIDMDSGVRLPLLLSEIADKAGPPTVLLRGAGRWVERFEPVVIPKENQVQVPVRLRENGVYVITGGLGNIGLALAGYLAQTVSAKLVLVGRSPFPDRIQWQGLLEDDQTSFRMCKQIRSILEMEENGNEVMICEADVSDKKRMTQLFSQLEKRFGELNGVIHAAGLVGERSFVTLNDARSEEGKSANYCQFLPKVEGTDVLADLLSGREFDFCLVCSSLSPILGGLGFAAYSATNLYADSAVEKYNRRQPGKWLTVNWEGWMFEEELLPEGAGSSSAFELGMTPAEGVEVFSRIVSLPHLERIVISSGNLTQRLEQWIERKAAPDRAGFSSSHARPEFIGAYTAPETETEKELVDLWGKLLGIDGIGIHDSFFELGGNSLLLTQLVAMIRRTFQAELALSAMFEQPTVAEMGSRIDESKAGLVGSDERDVGFL